jgi:hypothetical protein
VDSFAEAIYAAIEALVEKVPVTSILIDAPVLVNMPRGGPYRFSVILNPGASDEGVVWSISDTSYGSVDNDGTVTIFNKTGTVTLTATDTDSGLSCSIALRIT